jgi:hypothetical protein
MRTAIFSLIALAGIASSASAQEQAAPAATTVPAPVVEAPPVAPPVPEKVYSIPTEGEVGQIIGVINNICKPLVRGGNLEAMIGKDKAYKKNKRDGTYTTTLVAKPYTLTLVNPGSNREVCRIAINYTPDAEKPIIVGLNIYSLLHKPELLQQRNDYVPATDYKRITNSWEYYTDHESIGLVFLQLKQPDGTPAKVRPDGTKSIPGTDLGEILYSERKF